MAEFEMPRCIPRVILSDGRDAADVFIYAAQRVDLFAEFRRYSYKPEPDPALTARPVQGSHRFMIRCAEHHADIALCGCDADEQYRTAQYRAPQAGREIPAADPDAGFSARVDRAIEELAAAVASARKNGRGITGEQHTRILHIPDHD